MHWLTREARQASWLSIVPGSADAGGKYHSITFDTPDASDVNYCVITTVVSGQERPQMQRTDSEHTEIKANDISDLEFSLDSSKKVLNIRIQASKTFRSFGVDRTFTFALTEKVRVRNP